MSHLFRPTWILGSILALMLTPALAEKPPVPDAYRLAGEEV